MPAPSVSFDVIPSTDLDPDSPITTELMTSLYENTVFNNEWLGQRATAQIEHAHAGFATDGTAPVAQPVDLFQLTVDASGAAWTLNTGALALTPRHLILHWCWQHGDAANDVYYGWGHAHGTAATEQNGMSVAVDDVGPVWDNVSIDANDVMGFTSVPAGGAVLNASFVTEQARVTTFDATGVVITTQSGAWSAGAATLRANLLILGG